MSAEAGTLGVLLAGGRGVRLGLGRPKSLADIGGRLLFHMTLDVLRRCVEDVRVVAPAAFELPVDTAERLDDPPGDLGPLAALVHALRSHAFERALVLGVDLPFLNADALRVLGERFDGGQGVLPEPGGRPQPFASWLAASAREPLAAALAAGERSMVRAYARLRLVRVGDDALAKLPGGLDAFFNLNTPDDLEAARRRLLGARA